MQIKKTKITEGEKHPSVGETPYNPKKNKAKEAKINAEKKRLRVVTPECLCEESRQ